MIEAATLWQLVELRAKETPDGLFAIDEADRSLSFECLRSQGERVAAGLHARGVREGDVVSWVLPTRLSAFVLKCHYDHLPLLDRPLTKTLRRG